MDFEQCEIRANRFRVLDAYNFEFVAEARGGPDGTYIVARTPVFPPYKITFWNTILPIKVFDTPYEPVEGPFHRKFLNFLVDHLVRVKWKPLANSGVNWYSHRFERPISLYVPDPDPRSMPYTIGDKREWGQKVLDLLNQYNRHPDAKSCRKLAEGYMRLGVVLEREREFKEAGKFYAQAEQYFESIYLADEALRAAQARYHCTELFVKLKDSITQEKRNMSENSFDDLQGEIDRLNHMLGYGGSEAFYAPKLAAAYRERARWYLYAFPTLAEPLTTLLSKALASINLSTEWYERVDADDEVATNYILSAGILERAGQFSAAESALRSAVMHARLKKSECEKALEDFRKRRPK